mmetsp:Transcript_1192/g.3922  ORF Transcript_1192/g.3922 Transcript_1192/m.3922 type:complete len:229 (+) Transcript_1192:1197-1883(+)
MPHPCNPLCRRATTRSWRGAANWAATAWPKKTRAPCRWDAARSRWEATLLSVLICACWVRRKQTEAVAFGPLILTRNPRQAGSFLPPRRGRCPWEGWGARRGKGLGWRAAAARLIRNATAIPKRPPCASSRFRLSKTRTCHQRWAWMRFVKRWRTDSWRARPWCSRTPRRQRCSSCWSVTLTAASPRRASRFPASRLRFSTPTRGCRRGLNWYPWARMGRQWGGACKP